MAVCSRRWLYQPTPSTMAYATWSRVRQVRRWISSVLKVAFSDSAIALSYESATEPTEPTEAVTPRSVSLVAEADVLAAPVGVMDQGARPHWPFAAALPQRHLQRIQRQVGAQVLGQLPAHDPAGEKASGVKATYIHPSQVRT